VLLEAVLGEPKGVRAEGCNVFPVVLAGNQGVGSVGPAEALEGASAHLLAQAFEELLGVDELEREEGYALFAAGLSDLGVHAVAFLALEQAEVLEDRRQVLARDVGLRADEGAILDDEGLLGAGARELEAFDRELAGYVAAPSRVDYFDELDVVAFDEELARGRPQR